MDPMTQLKCDRGEWGYTATVPSVGGGPGRFPLVRIVSRRFHRRAVDSHHRAEFGYHGTQKSSNRVHRFARLKTQGKHPEIQHKTPHHQAYTRAVLPSWHRLAVGEHLRQQRPHFVDRHPLSSYHILLVLLRSRDFGCDVDELRISSNARF
jgi:hypothetical protein